MTGWRWVPVLGVVAALSASVLPGCGLAERGTGSGKLEVVAAENFWGSIAAQVGGERVHVISLVSNPSTDPHDYEATPADARLVARARYVIANGAGYDAWVARLLAANPVSGRVTLDVATVVGVPAGGNPHLWYSPQFVDSVVDRVSADLARLDPAGAAYYQPQAARFGGAALAPYRDALAAIRDRHAGTPVGASESMFAYLVEATGLDLITPARYLKAVSDGTDPAAADKAIVEEQLTSQRARVFLFNSQNSTPEVEGLVARAREAGIPVVAMTETLSPSGASFQDWQTRQLRSLLQALGG